MDIADYFPTLVTKGESVYVVGTPKKPGNGYVGPYAPHHAADHATTTPPKTHAPTKPRTTDEADADHHAAPDDHEAAPTTPTTQPHDEAGLDERIDRSATYDRASSMPSSAAMPS